MKFEYITELRHSCIPVDPMPHYSKCCANNFQIATIFIYTVFDENFNDFFYIFFIFTFIFIYMSVLYLFILVSRVRESLSFFVLPSKR